MIRYKRIYIHLGHSARLIDLCRVKANLSARVPRNLGGRDHARLKRGPPTETRGILVPRVFGLITKAKALVSKMSLWGTKILYFAREEIWRRRILGKLHLVDWSNDATDMFIATWSEEVIQFGLENNRTSQETEEVYHTNDYASIKVAHSTRG